MVTCEGDFETATQRSTVDCRDHGLTTGFQCPHLGLQAVDHAFKGFGVVAGNFVKFFQVATGKEGFLGRGNDDTANVFEVALNLIDGFVEGFTERHVHGVRGLARHVDGEGQNLI